MLKTPLNSLHVELGARMVEFAGWEMPILYTGIVEEHLHTRKVGTVFDVSHMGRLNFTGNDAEKLLQRVCTRQLADMVPGQSRYSHVCNEQGGILDDVIVSRHEDHWFMVCNASNRPRIVAWLQQHASGMDVRIEDITESTLIVAIQGPAVIDKLSRMLPLGIDKLKRYHFHAGTYLFTPYTIFRSGYTGEDGVELILPAGVAGMIGSYLLSDRQADMGLKPAGLGARDTLRLEAGMPLYGHELSEQTDTLSADLGWCVDLNKDFIGADVLRQVAKNGPQRKLVGLEIAGRRIARQATAVNREGQAVGTVTSGTFSPTLQKSIAMAYVSTELATPGTQLTVDLGGKPVEAQVVKLPFYKRQSSV